MKHTFLPLICALGVLLGFSAPAAEQLNVLLLMADDLRDFGGAFTRGVVKTPNLDQLAARDVRFERAFAQSEVVKDLTKMDHALPK